MSGSVENQSIDKIIDLKTVQTNSFKNLFESLKEILTDRNLRIPI